LEGNTCLNARYERFRLKWSTKTKQHERSALGPEKLPVLTKNNVLLTIAKERLSFNFSLQDECCQKNKLIHKFFEAAIHSPLTISIFNSFP